jgi:hypothetical protein
MKMFLNIQGSSVKDFPILWPLIVSATHAIGQLMK